MASELGGTGVRLPSVGQDRRYSTEHKVVEVENNPVRELYDTGHNAVEIPGNPVHELWDTRT